MRMISTVLKQNKALAGRTVAFAARRLTAVFNSPGKKIRDRLLPNRLLALPDTITPEAVAARLDADFSSHPNPLIRGDRRAAAEAAWPAKDWPTLYMDIPDDLRRPVVWDGKLLGGHDVTLLAPRHLSPEVVATFARSAVESGLAGFGVGTAAAAALVLLVSGLGFHDPIRWPGAWASHYHLFAPYVWWTVGTLTALVLKTLPTLIVAPVLGVGVGAAVAWGAFWGGIGRWWSAQGEALSTLTRDAAVIHSHRAEVRPIEYKAYARQVADAVGRLAHEPLIPVGKATGLLRARGDMEAPAAGQTVALDGESLRKHVVILGPTGEGKTRELIRPLFRRIFAAYKDNAEHRMGAYVSDGKGTLWQDLQHVPEIAGRRVIIIGTGPGQQGVDLLKGMSPLEVANVFRSVAGQLSAGSATDEFWPEQASLLTMHASVVARALDLDPEAHDPSTAWGSQWTRFRPYSLAGIYSLASNVKRMEECIGRLIDIHKNSTGELHDAIENTAASLTWVAGTLKTYADETRGSIVANLDKALGKLAAAGELYNRFATGRHPDLADIRSALDGEIMMVAVGESEWGVVGKVISVWLKSRLYIEARKKLEREGREVCAKTSCAAIFDEFQMLVTVGADSDSTFWNIARETGVFGIAATQSVAALEQAVGETATRNLLNLFRTKIIMKAEEVGTIKYCQELAGSGLRGFVTTQGLYETYDAREAARPDVTLPAHAEVAGLEAVGQGRAGLPLPQIRWATDLETARHSQLGQSWAGRWANHPRIGGRGLFNPLAMDAAQTALHYERLRWEQQSQTLDSEVQAIRATEQAMALGLEMRPRIDLGDLQLGAGHVFAVVQRAGGDRTDILDIRDLEAA